MVLCSQVKDQLNYRVHALDREALAMCHRLYVREGLFVGPSSGAVLAMIERVGIECPWRLPARGPLVAVLSDSGQPYRDTAYNQEWLDTSGFADLTAPLLLGLRGEGQCVDELVAS
jgi:hypothetical protein